MLTPIVRSYQLLHNFVRPHEALDGRTPAKACGIEVVGEDKRMTLIQNASHPPTIAKTKGTTGNSTRKTANA